ncbi:uncharacterized protein METZ01_LOCUS286858 [marine metagenome]|uniref:Uncharacterized protein n=1 Tax=marine metagenome TaxID=408172 RepID=A0A382LAT0_9ZZZZ
MGAVKLRTHFFLVDLAVLVFVEGSKCLAGIFQFIGTQGTVFIRVNRLHHRIGGAKSTTTTTIHGTALSGATGSSAFTAASALSGTARSSALTGATGSPTLATAKLFCEKCLNLLARGALVLIELAVAVLVEFLDHGFPDALTTFGSATTSAFTAASTLSGAASAALSRAFLSL